jgi:tetratricopeptide (TPR) repeat protein
MMLPAHVIMNYRRNVRDCLVIGLGAGFTVGSVLSYPVENLTCAEIEPAVYRAATWFSRINGRATEDPRVRMVFDDGRHFLAAHPGLYDAIISEPSNLYVAGMANLYTREFYELALSRLKPGGIFSQWAHYYGADIGDCRTAIRTFGTVFPEFALWYHGEGDFFLIGSREPLVVDMDRLQTAFKNPRVAPNLATMEFRNGQDLAASMLMDGRDAMLFAGPGGICTDNLPSLEFTTPLAMNIAEAAWRNLAIFMAFRPRNPVPLASETHGKRLALGILHESRGALGRALAEYRRAIRLSPTDGDAWWRLARVLDWMGETERARGAVQKGLLVNPGSPILAGLHSKLGNGARKDPLDDGPEFPLAEGK